MRLEHLCDVEMRYDLLTEVEPSSVVAVGEGSVDRQREALSMRYWSCHVEYRPDLAG